MSRIRYKYQTIEFGTIDIHLRTLKDTQQFYDNEDKAKKLGIHPASWSIFGVLWPSSQILANYIFQLNTTSKRILEVGCGIGLSSILLNHLHQDITATDYHPEVKTFLLKNTILNNDKEIPFCRLDWGDEVSKNLGKFDLIIGSDLLYEQEHGKMLSKFINQYASTKCEVIIVDPSRGNHAKFKNEMINFGFKYENVDTLKYINTVFKGSIHKYTKG